MTSLRADREFKSGPRRQVPSLSFLANRVVSLRIFQANVRWRSLRDITRDLKFQMHQWKMPKVVKDAIYAGLTDAFRELQRWSEKHVQMFPDENNNLFPRRSGAMVGVHRGQHLRLFYDHLVWCPSDYHIDDLKTARAIVTAGCRDWPLMKFQFAACYAMTDLLQNDYVFDKVRRRCFRKQLDDHPVYEFWLTVLDDKEEWRRMFRDDRLVVDQRVVQVFHFAIVHGFIEVVQYLWGHLTTGQEEAIGFLWWKKICFSARHREMVRFLCHRLCQLNLQGMVRLTWDSFYYKIYLSLQGDDIGPHKEKENLKQLECLLENWCSKLREAMLKKENFRALRDTFIYNRQEVFAMLLEYVDKQDLKVAREQVDRVFDKKRSSDHRDLRNMVIQKQLTID